MNSSKSAKDSARAFLSSNSPAVLVELYKQLKKILIDKKHHNVQCKTIPSYDYQEIPEEDEEDLGPMKDKIVLAYEELAQQNIYNKICEIEYLAQDELFVDRQADVCGDICGTLDDPNIEKLLNNAGAPNEYGSYSIAGSRIHFETATEDVIVSFFESRGKKEEDSSDEDSEEPEKPKECSIKCSLRELRIVNCSEKGILRLQKTSSNHVATAVFAMNDPYTTLHSESEEPLNVGHLDFLITVPEVSFKVRAPYYSLEPIKHLAFLIFEVHCTPPERLLYGPQILKLEQCAKEVLSQDVQAVGFLATRAYSSIPTPDELYGVDKLLYHQFHEVLGHKVSWEYALIREYTREDNCRREVFLYGSPHLRDAKVVIPTDFAGFALYDSYDPRYQEDPQNNYYHLLALLVHKTIEAPYAVMNFKKLSEKLSFSDLTVYCAEMQSNHQGEEKLPKRRRTAY